MAEGRKCCVYLLNERKLELSLQPKLLGRDLLEIVYDHFKLKEREYFGIAYKSDSGHLSWLQDDKKVLEHDVVKKSTGKLDFQFGVKFYVDNIGLLKENIVIELFFLQTKSMIYKGHFEIEDDLAFKLAAHVLQITHGDFKDEDTALMQLRKLPVLSNKVFRDHLTNYCENAVLQLYKELSGCTKGKAILSYMKSVEVLPNYGVHFYKVKFQALRMQSRFKTAYRGSRLLQLCLSEKFYLTRDFLKLEEETSCIETADSEDKSGIPWWLGLSFKGILQFEFHDKINPVKTYYWRQLENLYFREKKFSIEVGDKLQRKLSGGAKDFLSVETRKKSGGEVKVFAWYGSPSLIKAIWIMSIAQHRFNLDRKQSKHKLKLPSSLTNLADDLTNNNNSLIISGVKHTPEMTRKHIKDVDVTVKKGSKDETPEVRAAKHEMSQALLGRRTEFEDRLYDKVQELKKLCLQESELTGKLPAEYVRYMDRGEHPPKIKKRVGAEFKVKLRNKNGTSVDKDYPTSVTTASSSSSGFSSEAIDPADELCQLETDFDLLTQIANAAKKLASHPNTKGRTRNKRLGSYKKTVEKLQSCLNKDPQHFKFTCKQLADFHHADILLCAKVLDSRFLSLLYLNQFVRDLFHFYKAVEAKINILRKKIGQKPSVRASMLIADDGDDMFEDIAISMTDGRDSERSSLSDGMILDDDTSLSSGADALSTHSTPAILNRSSSKHPASAIMTRKTLSPADVDISDIKIKRSLTPPPSFDRSKKIDSLNPIQNGLHGDQYNLLPSPQSSSGISIDSTKAQQTIPMRDWLYHKWEVPRSRPNRGWHESSLDSIDTTSTNSRQSEDHDLESSNKNTLSTENIQMRIARPLESPALAQKVDLRGKKRASVEKLSAERPPSANSNQNNHNANAKKTGDVFNMSAMRREASDGALSDLSMRSNPSILPSDPRLSESNQKRGEQRKTENLPQILEVSPPDNTRKRSSSFSESSAHRLHLPHRGVKNNPDKGTLKAKNQPQYLPSPQVATYNVQQALSDRTTMEAQKVHSTGAVAKDKSSQHLQPPIFDTNVNIRMQYQNRNNGQYSLAAPGGQIWWSERDGAFYPGTDNRAELGKDPNVIPTSYPMVPQPHLYYSDVSAANTYNQGAPSLPRVPPVGDVFYPHQGYTVYSNHPAQSQHYMEQYGTMTSMQRDFLNNEVYQDIGMGWVPSLFEYSSRASVCESASAQSKKEDILRVLEDHIAMKRTPSNASSRHDKNMNKVQQRIREQYRAAQQKDVHSNSQERSWAEYQKQPNEKTWANYQKQPVYTTSGQERTNTVRPPIQRRSPASQTESETSRTNIFLHKPPPPPQPKEPPVLYKTQRQPRMQQQKSLPAMASATAPTAQRRYNTVDHPGYNNPSNQTGWHDEHELKQQILLQHYMHHDRRTDPLDYVHANVAQPATSHYQQFGDSSDQRFYHAVTSNGQRNRVQPQRWMSQPSEAVKMEQVSPTPTYGDTVYGSNRLKDDQVPQSAFPKEDTSTVVVQSFTKSPEGHAVSVFTVAKSAPSTPLTKRHKAPTFFPDSVSSDDDEEVCQESKRSTIKRQPNSTHQSADDLLNAVRDALDDQVAEKSYTPGKSPAVIIHTPSFQNKVAASFTVGREITNSGEEAMRHRSDPTATGKVSERFFTSPGGLGNVTERTGRQKSRSENLEAPLPPPRVKRARSKPREKVPEKSKSAINGPKPIAPVNKALGATEENNKRYEADSDRTRQSGNASRPPPTKRNSSASTHPVQLASSKESSPMKATKSKNLPMVYSGTLPRAFKSKTKTNRSGAGISGIETIPVLEVTREGRSKREPKPRSRNSVLGCSPYYRELGAHSSGYASGTVKEYLYSRMDLTPSPMLYNNSSSRADGWRPSVPAHPQMAPRQYTTSEATKPTPSHYTTQPLNRYQAAADQGLRDANPNIVRYRAERHVDGRLHRGKLSASAEDLLWTDTNDNQAGTLV